MSCYICWILYRKSYGEVVLIGDYENWCRFIYCRVISCSVIVVRIWDCSGLLSVLYFDFLVFLIVSILFLL